MTFAAKLFDSYVKVDGEHIPIEQNEIVHQTVRFCEALQFIVHLK